VLKRERDRRQPLDLDMPERKILLTPEGKVDKVIDARSGSTRTGLSKNS
jgi:exoribonuclease R